MSSEYEERLMPQLYAVQLLVRNLRKDLERSRGVIKQLLAELAARDGLIEGLRRRVAELEKAE